MSDNLKAKTFSGLIWKFLERIGTQGVSFVVSLVLARLLMPEDYGALSILMIFVNLANVFIQSGMGTALIQRKDVREEDYSSVFYVSLAIATVMYLLLYFTSPWIASYYDMPTLVLPLRVLSLQLFPAALNSVQNAIVSRNMEFKKLFYRSIGASIPAGVIGIVMAYYGMGLWALVGQQLSNIILICVIMWFSVHWHPKAVFSIHRVNALFSFGWKLLVSQLINTLYLDLRQLIIGKLYTKDMLGYYNRGWQFPSMVTTNIDGSIQSVMFPTLSKVQDEQSRAKSIMRRSITMSSFVVFPMMAGLAACATPLVRLLLTDKWLPCVIYLQIGCIVYALNPIHTANLQAINAMGRSDIFLKLEIVKKIVGFVTIVVTVPFGIHAIAWGSVFNSIVSTIINAFPNKKLLNYGYLEQIKDLFPNFACALVLFLVVFAMNFLSLSDIVLLPLQIIVGVAVYAGLAFVFKLSSFTYVVDMIKAFFEKRGKRE